MICKHKLKITKFGEGSQKERYVCVKCGRPFAFYQLTFLNYETEGIKVVEKYVNKYYKEKL